MREKVRNRKSRKEKEANNVLSTKEACNKAASAAAVVGTGVEPNVAVELEAGAETKVNADGTKPEGKRMNNICSSKDAETSDTGALPRTVAAVAGVEDDGRVKGSSQLSIGWAKGSGRVNRPPVADTSMSAAKSAKEANGDELAKSNRRCILQNRYQIEELERRATEGWDRGKVTGHERNAGTGPQIETKGKRPLTRSKNKRAAGAFRHTGRPCTNRGLTRGRFVRLRIGSLCRR